MFKRIKIIANPISGGDARPKISRVEKYFVSAGAKVELFTTQKRGDATLAASQLIEDDCDLVVACGGDGTLNEVANGLLGKELPLAYIPLGTANVMALEMGIPLALEKACHVALNGTARRVTLAEANGRLMLMMAGVGFDAAAVAAVNSRLKRYTGKFSYVVAGIVAFLTYNAPAFSLTTATGDGLQVWHAIITKVRLYGGRFVMADTAGLETSELIACVVDKPGRLPLLFFWLRVLLHGRVFGRVRQLRASGFSLAGEGVPVQLDGDEADCLPLEIRIRPHCLNLIFPQRQ